MSECPPSALREIGGGGLRHRPLNGKKTASLTQEPRLNS